MTEPSQSLNPLQRLKSTMRELREHHRERHRPSDFGFVFADRVDYLDPVKWDGVTVNQTVFLSRAILRVVEDHGPENVQPRYALVFRGQRVVAALAAQIVTVTGDRLRPEKALAKAETSKRLLKRVLAPAVHVAAAGLRERLLVAGNVLSWGFHGVAFAPGEEPLELWPAIAQALYRIRRAEKLEGQTSFVMVKDLSAREKGLEALERFSYRPVQTEPNMVLPIDPKWRSYDDYLAALGAKYRRNAKDQIKKLAAAGCTLERLSNLGAHARRLHQLYLAVHSNASVRLVTLPETYLPALAEATGDSFRCTVIRRGDEVLGFVTSLRDGERAVAYYIGFDREVAASGLPLYLRLLHATIGDAIDWRCQGLSLGRTALEPKAALGGQPEPMSVWLRHRLPAVNWIVRGLLGAIPHAEAPDRNPFKEAPAVVGTEG